MQITNFNATNIEPQQPSGGKHPEGKGFPFQITNTFGRENSAKDGGMLSVEMTSPAGVIVNNFQLFNKNDMAREIAQKQLSTLCRAVGIFQLSFQGLEMKDWARELRGGRGVMDVGPQAKDPNYNEVKRIYDAAGNDPCKGPAAAPQPQGQGNWGPAANQPAASNPAPETTAAGGWGNSNPPAQQQQPVQQEQPAGGGQVQPPPWAK